MIKGIIFDLDGVLLSTDDMHYAAWKSIAEEQGICFDRAVNNRLRGVSRMASLDIILGRAARTYTQAEKEALAERKYGCFGRYRDRHVHMIRYQMSFDYLRALILAQVS